MHRVTYFLALLLLSVNLFAENNPNTAANPKAADDSIQSKTNTAVDNDLKGSFVKDSNYTGYYVFDGKMYYYNQDTGEFVAAGGSSKSQETESDNLKKESDSTGNFFTADDASGGSISYPNRQNWPQVAKLSSYGQAAGGAGQACSEWGSTFLGSKSYPGKDECDENLVKKIDEQLFQIEKYNERFENVKMAMKISVDSTYETNARLNQAKLNFSKSVEMLNKIRAKGCLCMK